jgi:hypothetical protein
MASSGAAEQPSGTLSASATILSSASEEGGASSSSLRTSRNFLDDAGRIMQIQAARRFEKLGMANLLNLQVKIRQLEKRLTEATVGGNSLFGELMNRLQQYSKYHISYEPIDSARVV